MKEKKHIECSVKVPQVIEAGSWSARMNSCHKDSKIRAVNKEDCLRKVFKVRVIQGNDNREPTWRR